MHFPIIELKDHHIPKDERMSATELYDDPCIDYNTDYVGDEYTEGERKDYLKGGSLQDLLKDIAKVEWRGRVCPRISFFSAETIISVQRAQMKGCLDRLQKTFENPDNRLRPTDLVYEGMYWRDHEELFHFEGCGRTAGNLISNAVWYAGKTLYIGAIFDAHI